MNFLFGTVVILLAPLQERPYPDPSELDVPFPRHSHLKLPWRGWMETRPAVDFLDGIGINYNVPGNDELAVRLLAEAGIRAVRKEIGWGEVRWDESGTHQDARWRALLALFKRYAIRPTLLLNCHQGVPCPMKGFDGMLLEDAPKGAIQVKLGGTSEFVAGRTGLSGLTDYWAAEAFLLKIDPSTGTCTLSKPLPKALKAGKIPMATLKYLPLYPPGTPEFEETAAGWVRYARLLGTMCREAGFEDFDFEMYNELTFGTKFLDIRNYCPDRPKPARDFLHEGGACWELTRRVIDAVKKDFPRTRVIWGFSNTTFFHTPVDQLPPGTDGQSYHPYGTGIRKLPDQEYHRDHPQENQDGFTPQVVVRLPEGIASTFIQTESIMRLINPEARKRKPPGVDRFRHYMTEHGVLAAECGVDDARGAWALKTKCALRSYCLWLHQGVDVLHYFAAWGADPKEFGILPPDLPKLPPDAKFDDVAPPPLAALRRFTRTFASSSLPKEVRPLSIEIAAVDPPRKIFDGERPLWTTDALAFLPWQSRENQVIAAVYVATWDALAPFPDLEFKLVIRNAPVGAVRLFDPVSGKEVPTKVLRQEPGVLEIQIAVSDSPRLLVMGP